MSTNVLVLPGIGSSGPQHWQSRWEAANPAFRRVMQRDWERPVCAEWLAVLDAAVTASGPDTVLVAHSLACLLVAHWAAARGSRVRGALLVAVPDPDGPSFSRTAVGFSPVPRRPLPFRSIVVASTDDPYGSVEHVAACASAWDSRLVLIGAAGHINAASGLGEWREGFALLESLLADPRAETARPRRAPSREGRSC